MPDPNASPRKRFLSLQKLYYFLKILCIVIPAVCVLYIRFGPQDIYWEQCPSLAPGSQPLHSTGFNIVNASFFSSPPLVFTVTVDVPADKVAPANTSAEVGWLLNDPNNGLVINLHDEKNKLSDKPVFGKNSTTIIIQRSAGIESHAATMINFLWQEGKYVRFIDTKLYSGSPGLPYYKKYPEKSKRQLLAQTKWQLIGFIFVTAVVALMTILTRSLVRTKEELKNAIGGLKDTEEILKDTKDKLTEAERAKTETEAQLQAWQEELAAAKSELSRKNEILESASMKLRIREEMDRRSLNPKARESFLEATEGQRPALPASEVQLQIKGDVAEEYERRVAGEATDTAEAKQKSSENKAKPPTAQPEDSGDKKKSAKTKSPKQTAKKKPQQKKKRNKKA